eukprot:Protomagalhaensia_wolfi_Nauph_80__91@NODE_1051_length_1772_cov_27_226197_g795_i0_p1_GENE_NODE_1051_length_1772_cov_27_226197_g795_i0NODE_1051_length_1772_cov_27_226197_g795_i0_p1_ORF_typecomplete_len245_score20_38Atg14/PF10186_9/0_0057ERM/PF00769_19/6e03ERM/PF00769_19/0_0088CALCOCO1/PF07888_11/0_041CCCAP/PF15964_5/0_062AAA_23/PF13476_6/0_064APG6_N/PF17675_1/0_16SMC_N/PF02463_19/0_15DUF3584/PF12128_8/0_16DUF3552/PF12072_8/0_27TTKRSYEDQ/PF10212_9/0_25Myosin_tail_1/PF01576_19/0_28CorA/PF01544_18/0_
MSSHLPPICDLFVADVATPTKTDKNPHPFPLSKGGMSWCCMSEYTYIDLCTESLHVHMYALSSEIRNDRCRPECYMFSRSILNPTSSHISILLLLAQRRTPPIPIEDTAMEIRIKDALDNTEAWLHRNKERKAQAQKQRQLNASKRQKLEQSRNDLLAEKAKADEAMSKIYAELEKIDGYLQKLTEAEAELDRIEEDLKREEHETMLKEESVRGHLTSIAMITGSGSSNVSTAASNDGDPSPKT